MSAPSKRRDIPWVNYVGLGILVACYAVALFNVLRMRIEEQTYDVLRIAHWQLELGVRDGLDAVIARFEEKKAREGNPVKIEQIPITERAYKQYLTTQLIGGMAPDLIEVDTKESTKFKIEFLGRYFLPMSSVIQKPNPLLAERVRELEALEGRTPEEDYWLATCRSLQDLPWMDTFLDGLRAQFNQEAQEYYGIGFSQFSLRMFYNKNLFRAVLGHDRPPRDYRELVEYCERIRAYGKEHGREIYPIASSKYQMEIFKWRYMCAFTSGQARLNDLDLEGQCLPDEMTCSILMGRYAPTNANFQAGMTALKRLAGFFTPGFMALDRMDSGFSFIQGNAAMITSGSWDAKSFIGNIAKQPEDRRFEVGIFDVPDVSPADPEFGPYFDGRVSEANLGTRFALGVTRYSRNPDLCVEFLQFCTTPENNTILNQYASWIPSVRGALVEDVLKPFAPDYTGYVGLMYFVTGGRGQILENQVFWPYISGEITLEEYGERLMGDLAEEAAVDWIRMYNEIAESLPNRRMRRTAYLAQAMLSPEPEERESNTLKLLRGWDNLIAQELGQVRMDWMMNTVMAENERIGYTSTFNAEFFRQLERERGL